jgi:hypothetical protein
MTEGAEGQRSAAICVLQWTSNPVDSSNGGQLKVQKAGEVMQFVFCKGQPIAENQLPTHCRLTSAAGG